MQDMNTLTNARIGYGWDSGHEADLGENGTRVANAMTWENRSRRPVLEPEAPYELQGVYGHCVFSNGLVVDDDGTMTVYYGAADRICAAAVTTVNEMIAAARTE